MNGQACASLCCEAHEKIFKETPIGLGCHFIPLEPVYFKCAKGKKKVFLSQNYNIFSPKHSMIHYFFKMLSQKD